MDVQPTNLQQLCDPIMSKQTKISEECFQHLVESMPRIIKAVLKAKGVQPGTSKVYLIKWPVILYIYIYVIIRRNLRSLSPSPFWLSAMVSSSLPPPKHLSSLDANSAIDTFCSTLTSCFDIVCPLSSRPAHATPSAPWLSDVLRGHRSKLRATERVWCK